MGKQKKIKQERRNGRHAEHMDRADYFEHAAARSRLDAVRGVLAAKGALQDAAELIAALNGLTEVARRLTEKYGHDVEEVDPATFAIVRTAEKQAREAAAAQAAKKG